MTDINKAIEDLSKGMAEERRKSRHWIRTFAVIALIAVVLAAIALGLWYQTSGEKEAADQQVVAEQQEKQEIAQEAQEALCGTGQSEIYDRDICEKLAEVAQQPAPENADAIEQAEIVAAFREYCAAGNCRGANGRTPNANEIAASFARFCADGRCKGKDGADASPPPPAAPGKDGRDGVDGKDGADFTEEMAMAVITTYCADGRCVGATGEKGDKGDPPAPEEIAVAIANHCANDACKGEKGDPSTVPGPPGRGMVSMVCQQEPDYSWIVTWSDGTSEPIAGPCRVEPQPGPPIDVEVPGNGQP